VGVDEVDKVDEVDEVDIHPLEKMVVLLFEWLNINLINLFYQPHQPFSSTLINLFHQPHQP
jgi:hypothetical protein